MGPAWIFHGRILWAMGAALVKNESPEKADMIVVLAGGLRGNRIDKAVQLIREGYAPAMLVSGPEPIYGIRDSVLASRYAISQGMTPGQVVTFIRNDFSTADEARDILPELRKRGVHRFLLVTSEYHTGRASRIFHRSGPDIPFRTIAAPDIVYWCNGFWWTGRECRKTWFMEATKSLTDHLGM